MVNGQSGNAPTKGGGGQSGSGSGGATGGGVNMVNGQSGNAPIKPPRGNGAGIFNHNLPTPRTAPRDPGPVDYGGCGGCGQPARDPLVVR
jgi:hypothetical protein